MNEESKEIISPHGLDERLVIFHLKWWIVLILFFCLAFASILWAFVTKIPSTFKTEAIFLNTGGFEFIKSGIDGTLEKVPVIGEKVKSGDTIFTVLNKKTEETWNGVSRYNGKVIEVAKEKGEWVFQRETLALIEKTEGTFRFISFLPFNKGQLVKKGMDVIIQELSEDYKKIPGKVVFVSPFVISEDRLIDLLGGENLALFFTKKEPVIEIQVEIEKGIKIPPEALAKMVIILSSNRLISYLVPSKREVP